jgi:hypothetical protein
VWERDLLIFMRRTSKELGRGRSQRGARATPSIRRGLCNERLMSCDQIRVKLYSGTISKAPVTMLNSRCYRCGLRETELSRGSYRIVSERTIAGQKR